MRFYAFSQESKMVVGNDEVDEEVGETSAATTADDAAVAPPTTAATVEATTTQQPNPSLGSAILK